MYGARHRHVAWTWQDIGGVVEKAGELQPHRLSDAKAGDSGPLRTKYLLPSTRAPAGYRLVLYPLTQTVLFLLPMLLRPCSCLCLCLCQPTRWLTAFVWNVWEKTTKRLSRASNRWKNWKKVLAAANGSSWCDLKTNIMNKSISWRCVYVSVCLHVYFWDFLVYFFLYHCFFIQYHWSIIIALLLF